MHSNKLRPVACCADFKQYIILLNAVWAVSGLGYLVSVVVKPLNSQLAGVLIVLLSLMTNGIFVQKSRMGRVDSELHLPQASFAYHLSTALYLVKEDTFVSFAGLLQYPSFPRSTTTLTYLAGGLPDP